MHTLELKNVRKAYDAFVAVDDISFTIAPGTMFGLLGPNGAGKTSTIRMMIGITMPDAGEVRMFGEPFHRALLTRVGYLPEERGLYAKMKVSEQLSWFGQLHGLSAGEAKKRAYAWGERLDIADAYGKKTNELSKGMQQKIQFIATLLHEPEFIIMDEPFSGLDPVNARLLEDELIRLRREGRTILFSTHRMDQVEKLCDSICLVNRGQAILKGDLREIKSRYSRGTVQIALDNGADSSFIGTSGLVSSMNKYEGYIEVKLAQGADSQQLLRTVADRTRVNKFELMEPSLEEIFIDVVGKANA